MKSILIAIIFLIGCSFNLQGQEYWNIKDESSITKGKRSVNKLPNKYQLFELKIDDLKGLIKDSPIRGKATPTERVTVYFPMADGSIKGFTVFETPFLDEELSNKYPNIKSYAGQGIDDASEVIRFSISHKGLSGMLFSCNGYEFIEPYTEDRTHYMVYKRKDRNTDKSEFECSVTASAKKKIEHEHRNNADDGTLRNFRLAVSTNGEYTNYHGGTVADALAAINTSMTRVNGIFEMDFNVTMTLIAETTDVIYTNANTDPYSNGSNQWNNQLQNTLTAEIGEANYDVGHLFAQGGNSGNAGCIGCVCEDNEKGSGWTSRSQPEGDPFDVDYVAHELGHQFGGNHTWTHGGNEGRDVQMEPGSGSTIMGYAGITGNTDVQDNSDPYFHAISIEQISDVIKSTNCQTDIASGNSVPVVDAGADKTIPRGTPFTLEGSATDMDGDALTYCWEQMDENNASTTFPSPTATTGVAFRSFNPTNTPPRTFPALATVLSGSTATTWEAIPNVGRTLNFRLTARDNVAGGGTNESDNLVITVDGNSGPFLITTQNTTQTFSTGETVTLDWDVANTDVSPVSCSNVDILISYDGGLTFTTTLLSGTPNDGSADVTMPMTTTTTGRFMVKCSDNYFFDINNSDFTVEENNPDFNLSLDPTQIISCTNLTEASVNLTSTSIQGFNSDINLSATGLPPGATIFFPENPLALDQSSKIFLNQLSGITGTYDIIITGIAGGITQSVKLVLSVGGITDQVTLTSPADNILDQDLNPILEWEDLSGATSYEYELATSPLASDVETGTSTNSKVLVITELNAGTTYYWRVRGVNICGPAAWSAERSFTTRTCFSVSSDDLPINISSQGTPTINSFLTIRDRGNVNDLNIIDLSGTHSYVNDLIVTVFSPDGSSVDILDRPCGSENNFDISLDDQAAPGAYDCPPNDGNTYQPDNTLSTLNGKSIQGEWTLQIEDIANQDGGILQNYNYEICPSDYCDLTVNKEIYGGAGSISNALSCAIDGDTIWLETVIPANEINILTENLLIDKSVTIVADGPTLLSSDDTDNSIIIAAGKSVSLVGFTIRNTAGTVILNNGDLTLVDMTLDSPSLGIHVTNNDVNSNLTLEGQCNFTK